MKPVSLILVTALLSAPLTASASVLLETQSKRVSLAGLDLTSDEGAALAHSRLKRAAAQVCGFHTDRQDIYRQTDRSRCYRESLAKAIENIDSAKLRAFARNS